MSELNQNNIGSPNEEVKSKHKMKLLLVTVVIVFCFATVLLGSLFGYKYYQESLITKHYNQDFNNILVKSKLFSEKISKEPEQLKTFNDLVDYYQKLKSQNNFESQMIDLNNNPNYVSLTEKKDISALGLSKPTGELDQVIKDIDIIQIGIQKSKDVENEIRVLESTTTTIDQFDQKIDDLTAINDEIKSDMLGKVVHPYLKKAHEDFIKALTYRGSYLSESKAANAAYLEALLAEDQQKQQVQLADKYIREGNNSYFYSESYYDQAGEANRLAANQSQIAKEKYDQQTTHADEAKEMFAKYLELMGEYVSPVENSKSTIAIASETSENESTSSKENVDNVKLDSQSQIDSNQQVTDFMVSYVKKAVEATREYDFSIVEPYIDTKGKSYKEVKEYLKYLQSKGIHEELQNIEVTKVEKQTAIEYLVSTTETYNITYKDGTSKEKSFYSIFKVVRVNNGLYVNALISTKEI